MITECDARSLGVIAYAKVNTDYTRRPEPMAIFGVLDALRAAGV
jgi:hypothetical protein